MDYKNLSLKIEEKIAGLSQELQSGMAAREDSRAFGAMVEKRITENWGAVCSDLGFEPVEIPGRRTIFDFACKVDGQLF